MSEYGKGGKTKSGKRKTKTSSVRIQIPVIRIHRLLREGKYAKRIGHGAPNLAAVIEHEKAEMLKMATHEARDNKKTRINTRHVKLTMKNEEKLNRVFFGMNLCENNVLSNDQDIEKDENTIQIETEAETETETIGEAQSKVG